MAVAHPPHRECTACGEGPEEERPVLQYVSYNEAEQMWEPFKAHADCAGTESPLATKPTKRKQRPWRSKIRSIV